MVLAAKSDPIWRLVLTSRPWKERGEIASLHGGVEKYSIRPLSVGKIIVYLREVLRPTNFQIDWWTILRVHSLLKQLLQNLIAATSLANIVKQEKCELPSNLNELYAKTVELMLGVGTKDYRFQQKSNTKLPNAWSDCWLDI